MNHQTKRTRDSKASARKIRRADNSNHPQSTWCTKCTSSVVLGANTDSWSTQTNGMSHIDELMEQNNPIPQHTGMAGTLDSIGRTGGHRVHLIQRDEAYVPHRLVVAAQRASWPPINDGSTMLIHTHGRCPARSRCLKTVQRSARRTTMPLSTKPKRRLLPLPHFPA